MTKLLSLELADPLWLAGLLVLPLLFFISRVKKKDAAFLSVASLSAFDGLPLLRQWAYRYLAKFLLAVSLLFLFVALARPQFVNHVQEMKGEGVDIILAVDTSGSMNALDLFWDGKRVNRLEIIKHVIEKFVAKRVYDRIGVIVFGDTAYTQCPLTTDHDMINAYLDMLKIGMAGDGTAIGNGLAVSIKRLKDQKTKSKVVILLTDGRNNSGTVTPEIAVDLAKQYNVKVYTVGVGSNGPIPFPEETPLGTRIVQMELDLDETLLKSIADESHGQYFRARDTEELQLIYDEINKLEKSEIKLSEYKEVEELFIWPLSMGAVLLLASLITRHVWLRVYP